jgi:hypothetical protein
LAHQQKDNIMPSQPVKPTPVIHRVKCTAFSHQKLNREKLRWFRRERPEDYDMYISDPKSDGSFVLTVFDVGLGQPAPAGQTTPVHMREVSLDQAIVDKIEAATSCALLGGCSFVIFQDSPKTQRECAALRQNNNPKTS